VSTPARLTVGAAAALLAGRVCAGPPAPDHPLIGTWQLSLPGTPCIETYEYRADGSAHTLSAQEETDTQYRVTATPDAHGAYVLTETILKSNGKRDCSGQLTPVGRAVTLYLAPLRGGFLMCFDAALQSCVGPMTRVPPRPPPAAAPAGVRG
jgi:hypothetical protein